MLLWKSMKFTNTTESSTTKIPSLQSTVTPPWNSHLIGKLSVTAWEYFEDMMHMMYMKVGLRCMKGVFFQRSYSTAFVILSHLARKFLQEARRTSVYVRSARGGRGGEVGSAWVYRRCLGRWCAAKRIIVII